MKVNFVKPITVSGAIGRELVFSKEVSAVPCCRDTVLVNVGEGKQTETVASARLDVSTGEYSIILAGDSLKFDNLGAVSDFEHANKGWALTPLPTDPPSRGKVHPDGSVEGVTGTPLRTAGDGRPDASLVDDGTGHDVKTGAPINKNRSSEDLRREKADEKNARERDKLAKDR